MKSKKTIGFVLVATLIVLLGQLWWPTSEKHFREGDIVMRGTGLGVLMATGSIWTHCGILHQENGQWFVYEANQGVQRTPWCKWKTHEFPYFTRVLRPKRPLSTEQSNRVISYCRHAQGCRYDKSYRWSDDRYYCSELVWKAYNNAGIQLSQPRTGQTFLAYYLPPIRKRMIQKGVLPNEPMVPPCDLIRSRQLKRVW